MRTKTIFKIALLTLPLVCCFAVFRCEAQQPVELLGVCRVPGTTVDLSNLKESLETKTPNNALGGLSAIEYSGVGNRYLVLADRGAGDGAALYACRYHEIDLVWNANRGTVDFKLVATHLLKNQAGGSFLGGVSELKAWDGSGTCNALDPEGFRMLNKNQLVISDEYGPWINVFERTGEFKKSIAIPEKFSLAELRKPPFVRGAFTNRGLEGIAITPNHDSIVAVMQGPLVQDGRIEGTRCLGTITRWIAMSFHQESTREFVYLLDDESTGVSEILAIDAHRFLVLERDSLLGSAARIKRIYVADISKASDVTKIDQLDSSNLASVKTITKSLLIDLLDPRFGFKGDQAPEKPEGLTWGPKLPDGRRRLVVCFDNDCNPANDSIFAAFAVDHL